MNSQGTETKSGFDQVWEKSDLETAVMVFQDKIPETTRKDFNVINWITVLKTAFSESKIKKEAWKNIKRLAEELKFSEAKSFFQDNKGGRIEALMKKIMCFLASSPMEINYCINNLGEDDPATGALLERLSLTDGLFADWTAICQNTKNVDVLKEAFIKAQKAEATFEQWQTFNRIYRVCIGYKLEHYLSERFSELRRRADTFRKKLEVYNTFKEEKSLAAEILKDMENTAEKPSNLAWVYRQTKSESIKKKILTAQDTFDNWLYANQSSDEDWLKELSLKRMKELAENHYHWSVIWCRDSSERGKNTACSNIIMMAKDLAEAKLAWHRAKGTSLEKKAQKKLREIVSAL